MAINKQKNMENKKIIHLGHNRFISSDDVSTVCSQKSAKFRATTSGELDGKPIDDCSDDELTVEAYVVVQPKIGQPVGLKTTDDLVDDYTKAVVEAINTCSDVVDLDKYTV